MRATLQYAAEGPIVTSHALQRWAERVAPGASQGQCETQILNALENGQVLTEVPDWVIGSGSLFRGDEYIVASTWPGVVLRVHYRNDRRVVMTVLVGPRPPTYKE
ncbi:MAG: DUF4258 domain-containing protein [Candidatus Dormibacteraceae bacterium]